MTQQELVPVGAEDMDALDLIAALRAAGAITDVSLTFPAPLSPERYSALLRYLGRAKRGTSFWIGDAIIHGEITFGERYAQWVEVTGLDRDTLKNYVYVCSKVAPARRQTDVPFSCHADVASLDPDEQTEWLDSFASYASRQDWRKALSDHKRRLKGEPMQPAWSDDITGISKAQRVVEVGELVCKAAVQDGDHWRVSNEHMAQLRAAVGMED